VEYYAFHFHHCEGCVEYEGYEERDDEEVDDGHQQSINSNFLQSAPARITLRIHQ